jgi:hypothetical protein
MRRKLHNHVKNLKPVEVVLYGLFLGLICVWIDMNLIPGGMY